MPSEPVGCVQHPETLTRLSCSACGDPICGRCARPSAVGQRCPGCARPASGTVPRGRPVHHLRASIAGVGTATLGGAAIASIGFASLILSALVGYGVGRAVRWGARGQSQQPFPAIAISCVLVGLATGFVVVLGTPLPGRGLMALLRPSPPTEGSRDSHAPRPHGRGRTSRRSQVAASVTTT